MKKKLIIIISVILLVIVILLGVVNNYEPFHFTNNMFFKKQSTKSIYKENYKNIDTIYIDVDDAIINIINGESSDIKVEVLSNLQLFHKLIFLIKEIKYCFYNRHCWCCKYHTKYTKEMIEY